MTCSFNVFTDLCLQLHEQNVKVQGGNHIIIVMFNLIKALERK